MDGQDRDVLFNELLDDIFAYAGVEVHQAQTCTAADQVADIGVLIFDALQHLGQDIVRQAVRIECVPEFALEGFERGAFIAGVEAEQEQQVCIITVIIRNVHLSNR